MYSPNRHIKFPEPTHPYTNIPSILNFCSLYCVQDNVAFEWYRVDWGAWVSVVGKRKQQRKKIKKNHGRRSKARRTWQSSTHPAWFFLHAFVFCCVVLSLRILHLYHKLQISPLIKWSLTLSFSLHAVGHFVDYCSQAVAISWCVDAFWPIRQQTCVVDQWDPS